MQNYVYPTSEELVQITQDFLVNLNLDDPIFKLFPIKPRNTSHLKIRQLGNYLGMQSHRGYNSPSPMVTRPSTSEWLVAPSVFGEGTAVDEFELTVRGNDSGLPVNIDDLVMECQDFLLARQVQRMRWLCWQFATKGSYQIMDQMGGVVHREAFVPKTYAGSDWSDTANATPLDDFRQVALLARGSSVDLGMGALYLMNQKTANYISANSNAADMYGRRLNNSTVGGTNDQNRILNNESLGTIVVYDGGYYDDSGTFNLWIPEDTVVVIGRRQDAQAIGEFSLTRNAHNPGCAPAPYAKVVDKGTGPNDAPPRQLSVHLGFNGGPVVRYSNAVVIMSV